MRYVVVNSYRGGRGWRKPFPSAKLVVRLSAAGSDGGT